MNKAVHIEDGSEPAPKKRRGRPPKHLVGTNETRRDLIRAGVVSLTEKGFASTGLDEVLKKVGVPKGSFYHYFESKEAFGLTLIHEYDEFFVRRLDRIFLDDSLSPLERLHRFFKESRDGMARYDFNRGCLIGNLGQEMSVLPTSYRQRLIDVFTGWESRLANCLREAQDAGEVPSSIDCQATAEAFWIGWEGAVLRAKLERNARPLDRFAEAFLTLIRV
ncbi:MAG: TetR/AcrR family transcriptional regulator [Pseudomonadota bacterium]